MTDTTIDAPGVDELPPGVVLMNGARYMRNARGGWDPYETMAKSDLVQDEMVRRLLAKAQALSAQLAEFKALSFEEASAMQSLLDDKFGVTVGGAKGNISYQTVDKCMRLQVAVSDIMEFGPELHSAKALFDECLTEWSKDSRAELRQLVQNAFDVDKEGQVNRAAVLMLTRTESADPRWMRAIEAIQASIAFKQSRTYVRYHMRATPQSPWVAVSLDLASV